MKHSGMVALGLEGAAKDVVKAAIRNRLASQVRCDLITVSLWALVCGAVDGALQDHDAIAVKKALNRPDKP